MMNPDHKHLTAGEWDRLIRFWLDMENEAFWAHGGFEEKFDPKGIYKTYQANRKFAMGMYRRLTLGYAQ